MKGSNGKSRQREPWEELEALVSAAQAGDQDALRELEKRYRHFVEGLADPYFFPGAEKEDVIQEAWLGFHKAVQDYRPGAGKTFPGFVRLCVIRQIISAVKGAKRKKHQPLTEAASLDAPVPTGDDDDGSLYRAEIFPGDEGKYDERLVEQERTQKVDFQKLTLLEGRVVAMFVEGYTFKEIASASGCKKKSVDNALQRARQKGVIAWYRLGCIKRTRPESRKTQRANRPPSPPITDFPSRAAVYERFAQGESPEEIAQTTGCRLSEVRDILATEHIARLREMSKSAAT